MSDYIKRESVEDYCRQKAEHYKKRLAKIEEQGDAITYDPTEQINEFMNEIAFYRHFIEEMKDIPSADVVERETFRDLAKDYDIVNCCGCKWWDGEHEYCDFLKIYASDFDFCSWGEREDSDE